MPDYVADDFSFIRQRLNEITKPDPATKYAVWYEPKRLWCRLTPGGVTKLCETSTPTLFDSQDEAQAAIEAASDVKALRGHAFPAPYRPDTPT